MGRHRPLAFSLYTLPFFCLLLAALPVRAANWAYQNQNYGQASSVSSYALTLGFTPSAGSLLIAYCLNTSPVGTLSVSDNSSGPGDTWTSLVAQQSFGSGSYGYRVWATNVTTGTAPTTVTCSTTTTVVATYVAYYKGSYNPLIQDGSAVTSSGSAASASVSFTTGSKGGDLVWSYMWTCCASQSSVSVASPFTIRNSSPSTGMGSADDGTSSALSANTQYTVTWSWSTSASYGAVVLGLQSPQAYTGSPTETLSPSQSVAELGAHFGNLTETQTASDSLTRVALFERGLAETLSPSNIVASLRAHFGAHFASVSETLTVSDLLAPLAAHGRNESEGNRVSDSLLGAAGHFASLGETLVSYDGVAGLWTPHQVVLPQHTLALPSQVKSGAVQGRVKSGSEPGRVKSGTSPVH
jgi:hypothetical protein